MEKRESRVPWSTVAHPYGTECPREEIHPLGEGYRAGKALAVQCPWAVRPYQVPTWYGPPVLGQAAL